MLKRIEDMRDIAGSVIQIVLWEESDLLLVFTDGTYLAIQAQPGRWEGDGPVLGTVEWHESGVGYDRMVMAGVVTQEEFSQWTAERRAAYEAEQERAGRRLYEKLHRKYGGGA